MVKFYSNSNKLFLTENWSSCLQILLIETLDVSKFEIFTKKGKQRKIKFTSNSNKLNDNNNDKWIIKCVSLVQSHPTDSRPFATKFLKYRFEIKLPNYLIFIRCFFHSSFEPVISHTENIVFVTGSNNVSLLFFILFWLICYWFFWFNVW